MTRDEAIEMLKALNMMLRSPDGKPISDACDALDMAIEALSAEAVIREGYNETDGVIQIEKQSAKDVGEIKHIVIHSPNYTRYFYNESMPTSAEAVHKPDYSYEADMVRRLKESLSAEAEPTVIRCKTLLNAEDFEAVATRIRKENRNVIVIPCETEVVSAEAVQGWIPCSERLPEVGEICLLTVHEYGWNCKDYTRVIIGEYSDNYADHILAWMPLPKPYEPKTGQLIQENYEVSPYVWGELRSLPSADAVSRESYINAVNYVEWLEKLIVDSETFEWLCEDTPDHEWCVGNCNYSSIQAECLRHLYEVSKGGGDE